MLRAFGTSTASSRLHPKAPTHNSSRTRSLGNHHPGSLPFRPRPESSTQHFRLLHLPTSSHPKISCSDAPHGKANQRSESSLLVTWPREAMAAAVVLGTAAFAGAFTCRPSLSVPVDRPADLVEKVVEVEEEEEGYVRLLERDPRDMGVLKMAFYGEMRKGRMAEAAKYAERMRSVEPGEVEWRLLQALSYELMGELGKAKSMFEDVLEEKPLFVRALHGLALALHKNQEDRAAFEMLNKALDLARRDQRVVEERNIQILIAQMHVVTGDLDGGLKRFQELIDENPRDFRPFLCQGIIYSLLGSKSEANKQFEIYRSLVPEEFPQRSFLDDVVFLAETEPQDSLKQAFESEFSSKK